MYSQRAQGTLGIKYAVLTSQKKRCVTWFSPRRLRGNRGGQTIPSSHKEEPRWWWLWVWGSDQPEQRQEVLHSNADYWAHDKNWLVRDNTDSGADYVPEPSVQHVFKHKIHNFSTNQDSKIMGFSLCVQSMSTHTECKLFHPTNKIHLFFLLLWTAVVLEN